MGLFEAESLLRSAKQIDRTGVIDQDNNLMGGNIVKRNTKKYFCVEETASFSGGG